MKNFQEIRTSKVLENMAKNKLITLKIFKRQDLIIINTINLHLHPKVRVIL